MKELETRLKPAFPFEGTLGDYTVYTIDSKPWVTTDKYRLYPTLLPKLEHSTGPQQIGLTMLATEKKWNRVIELQARVAQSIQTAASDLDVDNPADKKLNYGTEFPVLWETFTSADDRAGVFVGFTKAFTGFAQLSHMSTILQYERIDMKSAAWIFGKSLRSLRFMHELGFAHQNVRPEAWFLETDRHGIWLGDLTRVDEHVHDAAAYTVPMYRDVADLARLIYWAIDGTDKDNPPFDSHIMPKKQYTKFLEFLVTLQEGETTAKEAFDKAYTMFNEIWPPKVNAKGTLQRDFHDWQKYKRINNPGGVYGQNSRI